MISGGLPIIIGEGGFKLLPEVEEDAGLGLETLQLVKFTGLCRPYPEFREHNKSSLVDVHGAFELSLYVILSYLPIIIIC